MQIRPCSFIVSPSTFQSNSSLKDNNGSHETNQVEIDALFKQDYPNLSVLSHTTNKKETISNSTYFTATIWNWHVIHWVTTTTGKYKRTRSTEPQAHRGLHVIRRMSTWISELSDFPESGPCPVASPVAGPLS